MKNRRNYFRFDVPMNLVFKPSQEEAHYSFGKTINYSRKGFCFESVVFNIPPEKVIEFKLENPEDGTFINGMGEIIWEKRFNKINLVGIKLKDMYKESNWNILDYCYNIWIEKIRDKHGLLQQ
jgi:hypothetical protein